VSKRFLGALAKCFGGSADATRPGHQQAPPGPQASASGRSPWAEAGDSAVRAAGGQERNDPDTREAFWRETQAAVSRLPRLREHLGNALLNKAQQSAVQKWLDDQDPPPATPGLAQVPGQGTASASGSGAPSAQGR
jgi:hypothetical protein